MKDRILIVVPTYNHLDYAARAIASAYGGAVALDPTVLVVDDASPEWTPEFDSQTLLSHIPPANLDQILRLGLPLHRFTENGGLTRSWNYGLAYADIHCFKYCCVTNSDVVFAAGWDVEIVKGLERYDLVGPVTNAPGTEIEQYVGKYSAVYSAASAWAKIQVVQDELLKAQAGRFKPTNLNGFCMVAKTQTWTANAFDPDHVFRPRNDFNSKGQPNPTPLMTLNEYELQRRWHDSGLKTAACLGSYVYHHRAVSRGDAYRRGDWSRVEKEGTTT